MSRRLVQHVRVAHFRVGMVSANYRQPGEVRQAPGAGRGRRGPRQLTRGAESDANPPVTARGLQQEMRLVASRLAYFDLPSFTALPLVTTGLTETADPMLYFSDLDENGYYTACKRQAAAGPPFFEARRGGGFPTSSVTPHSLTSCTLRMMRLARPCSWTARLVTRGPTRSPTPRSKLTKRSCGRTLKKWNDAENGCPHPHYSRKSSSAVQFHSSSRAKSVCSCPAGTEAR